MSSKPGPLPEDLARLVAGLTDKEILDEFEALPDLCVRLNNLTDEEFLDESRTLPAILVDELARIRSLTADELFDEVTKFLGESRIARLHSLTEDELLNDELLDKLLDECEPFTLEKPEKPQPEPEPPNPIDWDYSPF